MLYFTLKVVIVGYRLCLHYTISNKSRVANKRGKRGNIYLVDIYTMAISKVNANIVWFVKKKGTSCGIVSKYK